MEKLTETPRTPAKVNIRRFPCSRHIEIEFERDYAKHTITAQDCCGKDFHIKKYVVTIDGIDFDQVDTPKITTPNLLSESIQEVLDHFHLIKA